MTADGTLPADLVVLGLGVAPNSDLAAAAGIELGVKRAIRVDRRQATSADAVWAAGDCCESTHLVSGEPVYVALGTVANKQAKVAGRNIGGGHAEFPGVLGTAISKICSTEVARTGLGTREARAAGFDLVTATIDATTKSGYLPDAPPMKVKLLAERGSGRLLGAQIVGGAGAAKRIDTCAVAITAGMSVQDVLDLDLAYAPPFSTRLGPDPGRRPGGREAGLGRRSGQLVQPGRPDQLHGTLGRHGLPRARGAARRRRGHRRGLDAGGQRRHRPVAAGHLRRGRRPGAGPASRWSPSAATGGASWRRGATSTSCSSTTASGASRRSPSGSGTRSGTPS